MRCLGFRCRGGLRVGLHGLLGLLRLGVPALLGDAGLVVDLARLQFSLSLRLGGWLGSRLARPGVRAGSREGGEEK